MVSGNLPCIKNNFKSPKKKKKEALKYERDDLLRLVSVSAWNIPCRTHNSVIKIEKLGTLKSPFLPLGLNFLSL